MRDTSRDRAAIAVSIDPPWLLAPLFARAAAELAATGPGLPGPLQTPDTAEDLLHRADLAGADLTDADLTGAGLEWVDLAAAARDWPGWWQAALGFRPGPPAPRTTDLIARSPALQALWAAIAEPYQRWLDGRPRPAPGAAAGPSRIEAAAVADFAERNGRDPGRWVVRVLQIPVSGDYVESPDERRIVVSADLRNDPDRYRAVLEAQLPQHF